MSTLLDLFLHLDTHLLNVIHTYGTLTYVILFVIIFCETGLVVTPFFPGDSLLFAAGAFAAAGDLNVALLFVILAAAAILGNTANYFIGKWLGEAIFKENARILKKEYLIRTHAFYEKYGVKTIVLSRFMPIIRTVAPFVAGAGTMKVRTFMIYNAVGGIAWVTVVLFGGYFFGNIPAVRAHFSEVILLIIVLSILPAVFEWWRHRRKN
ncbi:MAG TPA: DedA family protein [Candidatus Peribacteraceae bacterium]|nr:DedA family protein [Candidatus Peribacteraceae bacterium]